MEVIQVQIKQIQRDLHLVHIAFTVAAVGTTTAGFCVLLNVWERRGFLTLI